MGPWLTISGIYGVMSYVVSQRSKEIGIRMAPGADKATVVRLVVTHSMRMAGIGTGLGAGLALAVEPVFNHQLQAVKPCDPMAYLFGAVLVAGASLGQRRRRAGGRYGSIRLWRCAAI